MLWEGRYAYAPIPISESRVEDRVEQFAEVVERAGWTTRASAAEVMRDGMIVPEHVPPVDRALIGDDGSVWLELADSDDSMTGFLMIDSGGQLRGQVSVPGRFFIRHATAESFWGMELDALDIPYIVQYSVEGQD